MATFIHWSTKHEGLLFMVVKFTQVLRRQRRLPEEARGTHANRKCSYPLLLLQLISVRAHNFPRHTRV
ncbi:hypothetical protein RB195_014443 [Necator americanus]|uniref:Uncharacterized protein n=1 Tax=Necator americanus TaxID=51031 RepID=A0ABR1E081_NECAM